MLRIDNEPWQWDWQWIINKITNDAGKFYPKVSSDFDMSKCPEFWRNRKVKINLLNMKDEKYMDHIQLSAYIAVTLDLVFGIGLFIYIWRTTGLRSIWRNSRGFAKFKFFFTKIFLGLGMSLFDTASGKRKLFENFTVQLESLIMTHFNIKVILSF